MSQNIVIRESEQEPARDDNFAELQQFFDEFNQNDPFIDQSFGMTFIHQLPVVGTCTDADLRESIRSTSSSNEFDIYLGGSQTQNSSFPIVMHRDPFPELFLPSQMNTPKTFKPLETSVELSTSVGVGQTPPANRPSYKISLVHELEETYRPRYKSDYFAQNGTTRKPRYVADRHNNHFITLQVPINVPGCIRIDWLTVETAEGDVYSMPYRFQVSNDKSEIDDENPLYIPIEADANGKMKIYLVLIKARQEELKKLQPLKRFEPLKEAFGWLKNSAPAQEPVLMPKQLIQKYQLEKSRLAFTFCSPSSDGNGWIPRWNTTHYSTVMTEISPDTNRQKRIACPNCSHSFEVSTIPNDDEEAVTESTNNKRKKKQTSLCVKKQHSLSEIERTTLQ